MTFVRSHWFWFFAVLTVVSGLDYWDHISRPDSSFQEAPGAWFGFTAASHVSLCVIAYALARLASKLSIPQLGADVAGVAIAVGSQLKITGPLWDTVFWDGNLRFDAVLLPVVAASAFYLLYRGLFALAERAITDFRK